MAGLVEVAEATAADVPLVRTLFEEYAAELGFDLGFQEFERELRELPGDYASPRGRLLLARVGREHVGCVALRPLGDDVSELKRLYVRPEHRRTGAGRALVEAVVREADAIGYSRIRLDTVPSMHAARALYRALGFRDIPPYRHNPIPGTAYLELRLGGAARR